MDSNNKLHDTLLVRLLEQQTEIKADVARIATKVEGFSSLSFEVAELKRKVTLGQGAIALLAFLGTLFGAWASFKKLL